MLNIWVSDLVEYLDFLHANYGYSFKTLSIHASVLCSILQPIEQTRASTAAIVKQLLKDVFRKNPPPRVWAETWDIKTVIDLLYSLEKPSALNYTRLTAKLAMILAWAMVKRLSDILWLRITQQAM